METFGVVMVFLIALFFQHLSNSIWRLAMKKDEPSFFIAACACFGMSLFIIYKTSEYLVLNASHFTP